MWLWNYSIALNQFDHKLDSKKENMLRTTALMKLKKETDLGHLFITCKKMIRPTFKLRYD